MTITFAEIQSVELSDTRRGDIKMATLSDWNAYINLLHELALVEGDLREWATTDAVGDENEGKRLLASDILFERFGLETD